MGGVDVLEQWGGTLQRACARARHHNPTTHTPKHIPNTFPKHPTPPKNKTKKPTQVRAIGRLLGVPETFIKRHPFPGPGMGVRILGDVTAGDALRVLREVDEIFIQTIRDFGLYDEIWQAFAVFLPIKTVGVQGDQRTHSHVVGLRAVTSADGMTADWYAFSAEFLRTVSSRICNKVRSVNRVVYDITSKPPSTIEWE